MLGQPLPLQELFLYQQLMHISPLSEDNGTGITTESAPVKGYAGVVLLDYLFTYNCALRRTEIKNIYIERQ